MEPSTTTQTAVLREDIENVATLEVLKSPTVLAEIAPIIGDER